MPGPLQDEVLYEFDEFQLDPGRGTLSRCGREVRIRPKSYAVLVYLVEHPERLISKDELLEAVWPHRVVTEDSLTQCLINIRRALGDQDKRILRTVPRRGVILDVPVEISSATHNADPQSGTRGVARLLTRPRIAGLMVLAMLLAVVTLRLFSTVPAADISRPMNASESMHSIVVLPFSDLSPGETHAYLAAGIAEEIQSTLTRLPALQVMASTTARTLAEAPGLASEAAARHGVRYLVDGSVRKWGDRLRISVRLIDTRAQANIWSNSYDRRLDDLIAIQQDVATSVADSLQLSIPWTAPELNDASPNRKAYNEYLKGRYFFKRRAKGDLELALNHLRTAVEIDPDYGRAWAALAGVYDVQLNIGQLEANRGKAQLLHAAAQALRTAPDLAETHVRLSHYYRSIGDKERAERHWRTAQELASDDDLVRGIAAGKALLSGRYDEALALQKQVVSRDPLSAVAHGNTAAFLLATGHWDLAEEHLSHAERLHASILDYQAVDRVHLAILRGQYSDAQAALHTVSDGARRDQALAMVHRGLGATAEARSALGRLLALPGAEPIVMAAEYHSLQSQYETAFELLSGLPEAMTAEESTRFWPPLCLHLRKSPFLIPLRDDPRWEPLVSSLPVHITSVQTPIESRSGTQNLHDSTGVQLPREGASPANFRIWFPCAT